MSERLSQELSSLKLCLECPVCLSLPDSTPIYQCENGHILCKSCHQSLDICPQCRKPLGLNRSLMAERLLEVFAKPCPLSVYGCDAKVLPDHEQDHMKQCGYRQVHCPVKDCPYIISIKNAVSHLQDYHEHEVTFANNGVILGLLYTGRSSVFHISCYDQDFIAMKRISSSRQWHFWIYGIGSSEEMTRFSYLIQLKNQDGSSEISWKEPVVSLDKPTEDVINDGDALVLTDKVISRLLKKGAIRIKITISRAVA